MARELGLLDKILESGWGSLSSRESGRIGGVLARKLQQRGERELPGGCRNNST
ncbi:MAG TPA: small, acid-soluble spore protein, alpha/beta type [Moorella mulderi]|nr:small, acid-soluble spore protein, alpha/beta type [Moorella mulderi]